LVKRVGRVRLMVGLVAASLVVLAAIPMGTAYSTSGTTSPYPMHRATGLGSCTLRGFNPNTVEPEDVTTGPVPMNYRPDNFDCSGARFAGPGVEFAKFPQPKNFKVQNRVVTTSQLLPSGKTKSTTTWQPTKPLNVTTPYFPPFTHFVIIYRENHTFDDYLGDCATTVHAGCNGVVQSTNHISSVPELHTLAKTYALDDAYSTGTQPPSGPNHWWLFSGQSASSSQQQSWPSNGTVFDRFLHGDTVPAQGTSSCSGQTTSSGTGSSPYTFVVNGDIYWMLNSGTGYWKNPTDGKPEVLPIDRPGTTIPEEINYNQYTCQNLSVPDSQVASGFTSFVSSHGLPAYSYVELFNDHPGSSQNIPENDTQTGDIVNSLMSNATYKNNTLIIVTEDDTQNGANGTDHVSNTYRVPLVVIGSPTYVKQNYLSHVAYTTSNVIAAMERVMDNVSPGIINPNGTLGLTTFPMTTADQSALGDPLEDFWIQGSTPLSATASASPTTGNAPLATSFTASATGGTAPYTYSWNFGDGSTSTAQNPSHTYQNAGTYTATVTVTDSSSPAKTASSSVQITVNAVGGNLTATASGNPTSGQIPLTVNFTGTATGGTPPYGYSWNFGDGSATSSAQSPSHTYQNAGTYTATLTVTDSESPAKSVSASVSVTASPINGTVPSAPQNLTATGGNGQVTLNWQAPASDGGEQINAYEVFRGTSSGTEQLVTSGGCSNVGGTALSCTDTGLANGTTYYYYMTAANPIGTGPQSNEASATPSGGSGGCTAEQLLGNPGFESGTASPWTATAHIVNKASVAGTSGARSGKTEPAHSGSWDAWLDGYGTTHTDYLGQTVTLPSGCTSYTFTFYMHIDTAETTTTTKYDTLKLQVLNTSGTVLKTLYTYSNLNANTGYSLHTFTTLGTYAGQTIKLRFVGKEDYVDQTSFVIDDAALNVSP
jgi:PKD repeat protein